jgi:LysR family hydrogen peroxide-inducible transcriptional activator
MNLQQLHYIVAVDTYRHFITAADKCHVTQATLSSMIRKLEDELGVLLFDRSRQPVVPTAIGEKIIAQARRILKESGRMKELIAEEKGIIAGVLKIGIIPTLAPYLLPLFVERFLKKYPAVKLIINEAKTAELIRQLEAQELDAALLATPLNSSTLKESPLFLEPFSVYASAGETVLKKKYVLASDIDVNHLWMLQEGHCFRDQVVNLCALHKKDPTEVSLEFQAGSFETLIKMVDVNSGITILPELATKDLQRKQKNNLRQFRAPVPSREISLVTYRHFVKEKMLDVLRTTILEALPASLKVTNNKNITALKTM